MYTLTDAMDEMVFKSLPNMSIYLYMHYIYIYHLCTECIYIYICMCIYIIQRIYRFCLRDRDALLFAFEDGSQIQQGKIKEDQSLIRSV